MVTMSERYFVNKIYTIVLFFTPPLKLLKKCMYHLSSTSKQNSEPHVELTSFRQKERYSLTPYCYSCHSKYIYFLAKKNLRAMTHTLVCAESAAAQTDYKNVLQLSALHHINNCCASPLSYKKITVTANILCAESACKT